MKKYLTTLLTLALLFICQAALAHYMWIETAESGKFGKAHTVKVYFGEYTYGVIEDPNGETFDGVKSFKLYAISPSGVRIEIPTVVEGNSYQGTFVPEEKGVYTVAMNNDEIDVIDYTQYDFGIFKTHYHSTARVVVGKETEATVPSNTTGLVVINTSSTPIVPHSEVTLKVLYKGEPVKEQEVTLFVTDMWSKKVYTDESGAITFTLPWKTKYTLETTKKEEVPGTYNGEEYEFIWHCATYSFTL